MLKKVKGGWVVVHCHGRDAGVRIAATKHPVSKAKALAIHRAIIARKHGS
ncbi:MAG: hypothetical protein N3A38_14945 [Planctomycetota bacterium]|nr:hypothetical protein [Planctomycetota bacterium]